MDMPAPMVKFLDSPLQFTNAVFEKRFIQEGKKMKDVLNDVLRACNEEIVAGGADLIQRLPLLTGDNLTSIADGSVVRYRCMIQDMREPEYFLSVYTTTDAMKPTIQYRHCNLWQESIRIPENQEYQMDAGGFQAEERHVFVGSQNPADTTWVRQNGANDRDDAQAAQAGAAAIGGNVATGQCQVKIYHNGEQVKLNDVLDVIGIYYSRRPVTEGQDREGEAGGALVLEAHEPLGETISMPSIHVFCFKKLLHQHPVLNLMSLTVGQNHIRRELIRGLGGDMLGFRNQLVAAMKQHLFNGDELVTEYFLCHLMSSVYSRQDVVPVGQFTLNLFGISADWTTARLYPCMELMLTQLSYLLLSLGTLNSTSLVPRKCYRTDQLISGRLQLPKGTSLVIDETKLEAGQLNEQGVRNVAALKTMIKWQKLDYDFVFNTYEFHTDYRTLLVSEGPSILPHDYALPVRSATADENGVPGSVFNDKAFMDAARIYFALAPLLTVVTDDAMQSRVQEDFVAMRRVGDNTINGDYLHRLLTMARMLALSHGDSRLRVEIWEKAKRMESDRLTRLKEKQPAYVS